MTRSPRPNKRLGQHFLSDPRILGRIVEALDPHPDDVVLEIGPGQGSLTCQLLALGLRVVAVEKDRRLAHECGLRIADCGAGRGVVVTGDALRFDWHSLVASSRDNPQSAIRIPQWKIVGNIPYNITSPLIDKALTPPYPERVVFLVQAEVADRVVASPGSKTYGALSVGVQAVCQAERLFTVPAGAFRPPPKVQSAVLRLTPLATPVVPATAAAVFRAFVTRCFSQRRKQLRNVVAAALQRPPDEVAAGLAALGLDPRARPEQLGPGDFARLLRWGGRL